MAGSAASHADGGAPRRLWGSSLGAVVAVVALAAMAQEPRLAIPLGWPVAVAATDRHVYVGDCLNHRVVRADKTFAVEATCPIP